MTDASDETRSVETCHLQLSSSLLEQNVFQENVLG
jgi:hypothetical protein